ncbi:LipL32 family surface lipoprotein [Tenacibaculum piscium]|uniref:LipL32 family surface lipoprotein n=1 Tax=Tenacibaculum piscium TaxID=1458515 RepID=UPI001F38AD3B|nr:LipL32 family surface lipoprotein [Tenacibaculum piscium]MCG8184269.1 Lipl32 family lipoprotein [Tenacibaculum piscium]MCG8205563.1 Lipl32 family lipoprotein [Tenacibaculum piscium]
MKNIKKIVTSVAIASIALGSVNAQKKLGSFGGLTQKNLGFKKVRLPYTDVVSYKGFVKPGNEDETREGKKFYYLYVWVPAIAPELGVRMVSPVGKNKAKNAIVSDDFEANKDSKDYFDTYITLERSSIVSKNSISESNVKSAKWFTLAKNDDSSEMPKLPSGSKYNSLLRYKSKTGDPLKALTVGLYRIGFTTYKKGEVKGTFLAQIGAPVKLPGILVAKSIAELKKQM